jgi:chemotaxis protein MotB
MSRKVRHHGGAWKVAYADFVTTMMALFLVLWLSSQDRKIKEAVQRAFGHPFASLTKESTGLIPSKDVQAVKAQTGNFDSASAVELNMLRRLADDLMKSLENTGSDGESDSVKLELVPEGMRISVFDRARRPIFKPSSAKFTEYGQWIFSTLAWEISRYPQSFLVELEGHTEKGFSSPGEYSSWELSADRANAARRRLVDHGVETAQVRKVAGFGDTVSMPDHDPVDEANRRVVVLLKIRAGHRPE